jgi:hypothetical protein
MYSYFWVVNIGGFHHVTQVMRLEVLLMFTMKMAVFQGVTLCSLSLFQKSLLPPLVSSENKGNKFLWNTGRYLPYNMVSHSRKQLSSCYYGSSLCPQLFFEWWEAEEAQIIKNHVSLTNVTSSCSRLIAS